MSYGFNAGEVFKIAIQIEENGKKFYEESQKAIDNADVKKLFADLAQQEIEHKKKFENLSKKITLLPMDARNMEAFSDNYFDFIFFSRCGIDYVDQNGRLQIIREIRRILKKGGFFTFQLIT